MLPAKERRRSPRLLFRLSLTKCNSKLVCRSTPFDLVNNGSSKQQIITKWSPRTRFWLCLQVIFVFFLSHTAKRNFLQFATLSYFLTGELTTPDYRWPSGVCYSNQTYVNPTVFVTSSRQLLSNLTSWSVSIFPLQHQNQLYFPSNKKASFSHLSDENLVQCTK